MLFHVRLLTLCFLALVMCPGAPAQGLNQGVEPVQWTKLHEDAQFDISLPTLEEVTGIELGQRPLRPEEVLAFYRALADASPRARLVEYARSHEDRPLVALAVSDPATINDLAGFKTDHQERMDPRIGGVPSVADLKQTKAVAWMAYGIHGDELSSTDAAAALAYWLVAGTDDQAKEMRENLLVFIDPCENPDGRSRYLAQITSFAHKTANPDQHDLSHRAVWPWGRGNHYLFDMNRDWFSMVQPESQRARLIAEWTPQILVDSHEMGANSSYLFPPPRHPYNPFLPPNTGKWEIGFSDDQASALDKRGFPYYSGEWNEEFFPGYGSSWSSYHGTIGILYEMSRTSGTLVQKKGGTVRTFAQAIEHQYTSSVANLNTLVRNRSQVLHDHISGRQVAVENGRKGMVKAWVFPRDPRQPNRTHEMAKVLQAQGLEVQMLTSLLKVKDLVNATTGEKITLGLDAGTLMVRMDQPTGYLAHALLDPHVPMETNFFQEERQYLEKQKGSRLYETTAWAVPLARGVPAYWTGKVPGGQWVSYTFDPVLKETVIPEEFTSLIIDGDPDSAPRLLADLLQDGFHVRVAAKDFTVEGHRFHAGALVIRKETNPHHLRARLEPIVDKHGVEVIGVNTSRSTDGPDLGGRHFDVLVAPKVGVVAGMPISPTDFGAIWHLLDQELDLRFSSIDISRLGRNDLARYNVLVFPAVMGGPAMYRQNIGPGGMEKIRQWIRAGGTAIGVGGGAKMLADEATELTQARFRSQALALHPSPVWSLSPQEVAAAGRTQATGLRVEAPLPEGATQAAGHGSLYNVAPVLGPGAAPFAVGHEQGLALQTQPMTMADWVKGALPQGKMAADEFDLAAVDARLRRFMPQGAFLRADLDPEFYLNFGLEKEITVWFGGDDTLVGSSPVTVGALFPEMDRIHLAGLLWPEGAARMAKTAYVTQERVGRGQVILFAANPVFRRWMKDTERMFCNAVLMGPGLGTIWSTPW